MVESLVELSLVIILMAVIMGGFLGIAVKMEEPKKSRKSKIGMNVRTYQDEDGVWITEVEEEEDDECEEADC